MPRRYPAPVPTRSLPAKPNLAQLQKQAKELLKAFRNGDPAAVEEVSQFERSTDRASFALADAQRVLARAYGFSSWPRMKQHIDGLNVETFCAATEAGDVATVRTLAKARPELVNIARNGGYGEKTALHFAVLSCDAAMTRALMKLGSDAHRGFWPYRDATSAHTLASERGYADILAIIEEEENRSRQRLSAPASTINAKTDEILDAILHERCDEAMRIIEADSAVIGACDDRGVTPLHIAAWKHNAEMVVWLLNRGAAVDAGAIVAVPVGNAPVTDVPGNTPLDYAALAAGWSAQDQFLPFLENARIDPIRFTETTRHLLAAGAAQTPRAAVAMGERSTVQHMQDVGVLTNIIHFYRGGLLAIAVRVNRPKMVSLLLDMGFDPNESTLSENGERSWGMPLWFAAVCGRHEIARKLLDAGADPNAVVYACGDPLCNAEATGDKAMKSLLLEYGAQMAIEQVAGKGDRAAARAILAGTMPGRSLNLADPTPAYLAEQLLWGAGGTDAEIVRMCLPQVRRKKDDPWWHYVIMHATLPASLLLILESGVKPDVKNENGQTPLHHMATITDGLLFAEMLLDAGASLTVRDDVLQSTPLGWACRWGRFKLVQLYLERGADTVEPMAEAWASPLAWAEKGERGGIVELLRTHKTG